MSSFMKYSHLPAYAEIANLEHELGVLRERYANHLRLVGLGIRGFIFVYVVAILLFIYALITGNQRATVALILILLLGAVAGAAAWLTHGLTWGVGRRTRFYSVPNPFWHHMDFLKDAIEAREQRLGELKAQQ
jgi:hypothetical protein